MLFEELHFDVTNCSDVDFLDSGRAGKPAWLIRLACSSHAGAASLAECQDLCEWFGVERRRATIQYDTKRTLSITSKTSLLNQIVLQSIRKRIQLKNEQKAWLYAAIDVDSKVVPHARLSLHRTRDPTEQFLAELKEKHRVAHAEFLVDGIGYLSALARADPSRELSYTGRNIVEKFLQTYTMRIERFHGTWNGSQASAQR